MLNKLQISANERFFTMVFTISKTYLWPDEREVYHIDGKSITCSAKGYNALKRNTSQKFLSTYTFTIK